MGEPSEREKQKEERPPTSRPLHNFTLPSRLKWGKQRQLRCMNLQPGTDRRRSGSNHPRDGPLKAPAVSRRSPFETSETNKEKEMMIHIGAGAGGSYGAGPAIRRSPIANFEPKKEKETITQIGGGGGRGGSEIDAVRQKLMTDLRVEADRMKQNILDENEKKVASEEELNAARPWNLRSRRGGGSTGGASGGGGNAGLSPLRGAESRLRRMEEEGWRGGGEGSSGAMQRPKFSLTLTKEEIEADFLAMTGAKPPRRPKRRPKAVQKQIDGLFPGSWLREVTPDAYKVPDNGDQGK